MIKSNYNVIAIMSGTSLDGVDIIYATYTYADDWEFEIHFAETIKYSDDRKSILSNLVNHSLEELQPIDRDYTKYLGAVILDFIKSNNIEIVDFIASHGHTALHRPENDLTYQIGNLQALADIVNRKVICDFRIQDVERGGQGAPLVPIGDRILFSHYNYCLNLGGFANVSFESDSHRIAFDICPVNIVLNYYVANRNLEYDNKGLIALKGEVNQNLLDKLNRLDFYKQKPPKSLGLEWVMECVIPIIESFELELEDVLRTFVEHIAIQISRFFVITNTNVLVSGGGVYNEFLMHRIKDLSIADIVISSPEITEYKEALVFGLLGVLKDRNEINCLKSVTGAKENHSSGKFLFPKS